MKDLILKCRNNKSIRFQARLSGTDLVISSFAITKKYDLFTFTIGPLHECRIEAKSEEDCSLWVSATAFEIDMASARALLAELDIRKEGAYFKQQVQA